MFKARTLLYAFALGSIAFACQDTTVETKSLTARVYNTPTVNFESDYLKTVDLSKLSEIEKEAVTVRQDELREVAANLAVDPNTIVVVGARCDRQPPVPCPGRGEVGVAFESLTEIELDLIGVPMYRPNPDGTARATQTPGGAVLVSVDGKKIFAQGSLFVYESLFQTAWYQFDVITPSLASKPLILRMTTQINVNNQIQDVIIEKPIPANTFLGNNIRK